MIDPPAYFRKRDAGRIGRQTRERERERKNDAVPDRASGPRILGWGGLVIVKTTGTITARAGATPGTGNAVLVTWSGTALGDGAAITLRNISAKVGGIGSGKYGFAVRLFGLYWAVSFEC